MAEEDPWGDLFAKAAEVPTTTIDPVVDGGRDHERQQQPPSKKRRKQKNKSNKKSESKQSSRYCLEDDSDFQRFCTSRLKLCPGDVWPDWLSITTPLVPTTTTRTTSTTKDCPSFEATSKRGPSKCKHCGASAFLHKVSIRKELSVKDKSSVWLLKAFAELRNVRCIARFVCQGIGLEKNGDRPNILSHWTTIQRRLEKEVKCLKKLQGGMAAGLASSPDELSLLNDKLMAVSNAADMLIRSAGMSASGENNLSFELFESGIRLIIACDAAYYRLYYLQITQTIPGIKTDGNNSTIFLPHPQDYFGTEFLTSNQRQDLKTLNSILKELKFDHKDHGSLFASLLGQLNQLNDSVKNAGDHPLCQIHRSRQLETLVLFRYSGWSSLVNSKMQFLRELEAPATKEALHETPAPRILSEWRDSCRDFMCNLYAYATLPADAISKLELWLSQNSLGGLVEVGAGTGYIAALLNDAGLDVVASDIHPTNGDKMNSYHGFTPSFTDIVRTSTLPDISSADKKALLLCYPPPESPMAYDVLKAYMRRGGRALIHVGEFKGLTGNSHFERLLQNDFECKLRVLCVGWGTDASHVTCWVRAKGMTDKPSILLPCCSCNRLEATKRCKALRSLVYCSFECFEMHRSERNWTLGIFASEQVGGELDFRNNRHFFAL